MERIRGEKTNWNGERTKEKPSQECELRKREDRRKQTLIIKNYNLFAVQINFTYIFLYSLNDCRLHSNTGLLMHRDQRLRWPLFQNLCFHNLFSGFQFEFLLIISTQLASDRIKLNHLNDLTSIKRTKIGEEEEEHYKRSNKECDWR